MIKEEYVSFEVAKLLKEKGFDEPIQYFYKFDSKELYRGTVFTNTQIGDKFYNAPTHQMATAWLREVYGLHIWVDYSRFDFNKEYPYLWNIVETKIDGKYWGGTYHKSSEGAVEAALKYALENLI